MTPTLRLAALLCFVTCLGTIAPAALRGQMPAATAKTERVIPEFEFHNTPLRDVIAYLRLQAPDVNIVLQGGLEDVRVSELKLRNVTVTQALLALRYATRNEVAVNLPNVTAPDMITIVDIRSGFEQANAKRESFTRAFYLPPWPEADFDEQAAATVDAVNHFFALTRSARTAAGEATRDLKPPLMEAHRPTHLLLVAGSRESVDLAGQVITELQGKTVATDPEGSPDRVVKATILGQVQKPGVYSVDNGTVARLITLAGGVTSKGDPKRVSKTSSDGKKTDLDLSATPYVKIREGDTLTVPEHTPATRPISAE